MLGSLQVLFGIALYLVGRWGMRNATRLVHPSLEPEECARRARTYRRGAIFCQVVGIVLVAAVVASSALRALS
ncbi:MAG: hypothetical protein QOF99_2459 [Pseudonocardiales bacterium]|jgi:hypothetical protein|nr:hypothetical protein [Pseudonocardiales bacterium]